VLAAIQLSSSLLVDIGKSAANLPQRMIHGSRCSADMQLNIEDCLAAPSTHPHFLLHQRPKANLQHFRVRNDPFFVFS